MTLWELVRYFLYLGTFVFGSGLAIVPFLHQRAVQQFGWPSGRSTIYPRC